MKNFAKLALFFTISFVTFFLAATLLRLMAAWIDVARIIPVDVRPGEGVADTAWKALPAAIYLSVLITLSYSARRNIPIPHTLIGLVILSFLFCTAATLGISRTEAIGPAFKPVPPIQAEPGLIISQSENSMILLKESSDARGSRLVSIPGRPLIYQDVPVGPNNTILALPAISFVNDTPWFIRSIGIDFSLSAMELKTRFEGAYLSFAAYAFSLILLLSSLRFLLELSQWPLANIFIGAVVFRLILSLEIFLNSGEINLLLASFLSRRVPTIFITPLVFCTLGILIILYTLLTGIVRSKRERDD